MKIDIDALRSDLEEECLGAYFGGNLEGALIEIANIDSASPEELLSIAERLGLGDNKYKTE